MAILTTLPQTDIAQTFFVSTYDQSESQSATKDRHDSAKWDAIPDSSTGRYGYTAPANFQKENNHNNARSFGVINSSDDMLMNIWVDAIVDSMATFDGGSLGRSLVKSERYLKALYGNDEYRMIISAHILNIKSGYGILSTKDTVRNQYTRALKNYWKSSKKPEDRMKFLRTTRSLNISPSGA